MKSPLAAFSGEQDGMMSATRQLWQFNEEKDCAALDLCGDKCHRLELGLEIKEPCAAVSCGSPE